MQITELSVVLCQTYKIKSFGLKVKIVGFSLKITNAALRTIDKLGIDAVIAKMKAEGKKV